MLHRSEGSAIANAPPLTLFHPTVCSFLNQSRSCLVVKHRRAAYVGRHARSITCEQTEQLSATVREYLGYLARLRTRMELRGFPPDDPLYLLVCRAFGAV